MAKVSYVSLLPAEEELYFKGLNAQSRFIFPRVTKKNLLLSKKRIAGLTQRSLLPQVAEAWNLLTESKKTDWGNSGAESNLNGYRLFVQDKIIRIKNDFPDNATPSLLHQSWVGGLIIQEPASEIKITQLHPRFYWVYRKVGGKMGQYEPVLVTEDLALPLKISLNYKAELESVGEGAFAKFYATVWSSYQGTDINNELKIDLDLSTLWGNAEATLTSVAGYVVSYNLFFHLYNVRGTLYIDNVKAEHSGQNWVRDWVCRDINQGFTKAFYQIPKNWAAIILPSGADYESLYKDFEISYLLTESGGGLLLENNFKIKLE
jgi:hypothetical protein